MFFVVDILLWFWTNVADNKPVCGVDNAIPYPNGYTFLSNTFLGVFGCILEN